MTIKKNETDRWDFVCGLCGFTSVGHETKASATNRKAEHMAEHEGIMPNADRS